LSIDTVLYNTKVFFDGNLVDAGIAIDDGKIVKIAKNTNLPKASRRINLNGCVTLPGLIDCHVHLRDQELAYKENFVTGTAAAAAGGVTSVIDMPNNKPVTMSVFSLKERKKLAEKRILVNVGFNSAFPKRFEEIDEIVKNGVIGFKVYMSNNIGGINVDNDEQLSEAFKKAAKGGVPVFVHAEDQKIIEERIKEIRKAKQNDLESFIFVHSPEAEVQSIQRVVRLVKKSGVHVHFCHVSSKLGLEAVLAAKKMGLPVTCEVTPHNLLLTSEQYEVHGNFALTVPPLRTREDVAILWNGLKKGFVDLIASDHAPHLFEEKNFLSVWETKPGVPGLETTLSLLLTKVNEGSLSFSELVRVTAEEPAKIFNLNDRGSLKKDNWADFVIVDMKREYKINSSDFFSKAKYSPFDGLCVKGKAVKTFVNGIQIMDEGEIVTSPGVGKIF
jgi:dihydroorotase